MQVSAGFTHSAPLPTPTQGNTPGPRKVTQQQTERPVTETGEAEPRREEEVVTERREERPEVRADDRDDRDDRRAEREESEEPRERVDIRV